MTSKSRGIKLVDAVTHGDMKTVDDLLSKDVDLSVQIKGDNAIHMAARTGRLGVIKRLKQKGDDLEKRNINGNSPVHYAAKDGYMDIIEYLSRNSVIMNAVNNDGNTPLHLAVAVQTMDIIEELIGKWEMDPNSRNKMGQTPLHTAVLFSRQEAMEALILCGASTDTRDYDSKKAEDLAKHKHIRDTLKIYSAMNVAMGKGYDGKCKCCVRSAPECIHYGIPPIGVVRNRWAARTSRFIRAKGLKITTSDVSKPFYIDRVGIILETMEIPAVFPTAFYCRREKAENTTVLFEPVEDEKFFSDIFHIKVSDVNRNCPAKICLPLYVPPSDIEELVLRFMNCADDDHVVDQCMVRQGVPYCLLDTVLVPETTCICVVKVRQRREHTSLNTEAQTITSNIDTSFALEVSAGTFKEDMVLSLQVYGSGEDAEVFDSDDDLTESVEDSNFPDNDGKKTADSMEKESDVKRITKNNSETNLETLKENSDTTEATAVSEGVDKRDAQNPESNEDDKLEDNVEGSQKLDLLITNVYQINILGDQPNKKVKMQIPLINKENINDLAIVCADERSLHKEGSLEILQTEPTIVNGNLVFEVSHFSVYFGTFRNFTLKTEDKAKLQRRISMCKDQIHSIVFFAMVKPADRSKYNHSLVVECCMVKKFTKRRKKWLKKGYKYHEMKGGSERDVMVDDEFFIDIQGCTQLSGEIDAVDRKLKYSAVRSSYKYYEVSVDPGTTDGSAVVSVIERSFSTGHFDKVAELPIVLELPPPPSTPAGKSKPESSLGRVVYQPNKDESLKVYPSYRQWFKK